VQCTLHCTALLLHTWLSPQRSLSAICDHRHSPNPSFTPDMETLLPLVQLAGIVQSFVRRGVDLSISSLTPLHSSVDLGYGRLGHSRVPAFSTPGAE